MAYGCFENLASHSATTPRVFALSWEVSRTRRIPALAAQQARGTGQLRWRLTRQSVMPMDSRFAEFVDALVEKHEAMMAMTPIRRDDLPKGLPPAGVYVFSEGANHLYVGRTRRLRRRIIEHSHPKMFDAPFAFRLAREKVGKTKASYTKKDSRKELLADPEFLQARLAACERIRAMDIRFAEEADPVRQSLLEIYSSVVLGTPYNEFKTT